MPPAEVPEAFSAAEAAAAAIVERLGTPEVVVVLGSGWHAAATALGTARAEVSTAEIPGYPAPSVAGHHGELRLVAVGGRPVLLALGRVHLYEGRSVAEVVHGVRAAVLAGARRVVLTNAAGGLDPALSPGQAVLIRDHLNLTGTSPLGGPPIPDRYGPRFCDLSDLYASRLRAIARRVEPTLVEGVYAGLVGPHYETPAEVAMLRHLGADLVGMSTALEAIAAHHLGAEVLGLSCMTNLAAGVSPEPLDHAEVLAAGAAAAPMLGDLLARLLPEL